MLNLHFLKSRMSDIFTFSIAFACGAGGAISVARYFRDICALSSNLMHLCFSCEIEILFRLSLHKQTSNGSWCIGIKG